MAILGACDGSSPSGAAADSDSERGRLGSHLVNRKGGYEFSYPSGWQVDRAGTKTTLTSPDGVVAVGFGADPRTTPDNGVRRFVASIRGIYSKVVRTGTSRQEVAGRPAVIAAGKATNEAGRRLRWLGISLAGPERSYLITIFTVHDSDPLQVLPPVQDVVDSFEIR